MALVLPLGMSLIWIASSYRARTHRTDEMVQSSPLSPAVRLAGETIGGILVAVVLGALALTVAVVVLLLSANANGVGGFPGMAGDLWLLPLIVLPALPFWAAVSRMAARYLPLKGAYLGIVVLWAAGVWLRPPASLFVPTYAPTQGSELTLLGLAGASQLAFHRASILILGLVLGLSWVAGSRPKGAASWRGPVAMVLAGAMLALASVPGLVTLFSAGDVTPGAEAWLARAAASPRWVLEREGEACALLSAADVAWAADILEGVRCLADQSGTILTARWSVVEAPVNAVSVEPGVDGTIITVPERLFRFAGKAHSGIIARRLTTQWVRWLTGAAGSGGDAAGPFVSSGYEARDGVRLYIEWVLSRAVVGEASVSAEVEASQRLLGSEPSPGPVETKPSRSDFPSDIGSLMNWRGGPSRISSTGLAIASKLWTDLAVSVEPRDLIEVYASWSATLGDPPIADPGTVATDFAEAVSEVAGDK